MERKGERERGGQVRQGLVMKVNIINGAMA